MEDGTAKLDKAIASMFSALSHSVVVGGVQHRCIISLGLTVFPTDATCASELLKNADLALYRAKELGRDRHHFSDMRASLERTYKLHRDFEPLLRRVGDFDGAQELLTRRDERGAVHERRRRNTGYALPRAAPRPPRPRSPERWTCSTPSAPAWRNHVLPLRRRLLGIAALHVDRVGAMQAAEPPSAGLGPGPGPGRSSGSVFSCPLPGLGRDHGFGSVSQGADRVRGRLLLVTSAAPAHREIKQYLWAGTETTALTLGWTLYLLSRHPEVADKIRREADEVYGTRSPTAADVERLSYTRSVMLEALRLYPPAWALIRTAVADDEIAGHKIKAGDRIVLCPYVIHHDAKYWEDPEEFRPERFEPGRIKKRVKYSYLPFGAGKRFCLGGQLSQMEVALALTQLLRRFRPEYVGETPPRVAASVTLMPKDGLPFRLHELS